ncbi:hypothetical protein BSL78_03804 [Apostichopus japonicus]|uniref:Uncharacterized protein n=1 Tax=Stichopus japonicus TaxID=307972 RepID=A0A2G8LGB5_STIJA|nr:hypothetical protein BSL78_03804 [Apostichopus japonicus]
MLTPNIANQQLQGSQPPVNPNYQLDPATAASHTPQPQQPYLQPQMPPHQQQTAENQPQQNPVTYPAPPPYQQYDQKGSLPPPPYQPQEIQTIQPQPIHAMPYNMSQQGQGVVIQQPQQFQQMPFQPVTVINTSDAGQSNSIQGMAITSIVLSAIATVCVLGCLCTIPAIVLGSLAFKQIRGGRHKEKIRYHFYGFDSYSMDHICCLIIDFNNRRLRGCGAEAALK